MLKILQASLQQYMIQEIPDIQVGFRKGRGIRDQIANICWLIGKAREFQKKTSISDLLVTPKLLTLLITTSCGKFFKRWKNYLSPEEAVCRTRSNDCNWTWNVDWFKIGKLSSGHRTGNSQFSFQCQRKAIPNNAQNTAQLHLSLTLAK